MKTSCYPLETNCHVTMGHDGSHVTMNTQLHCTQGMEISEQTRDQMIRMMIRGQVNTSRGQESNILCEQEIISDLK